MFLCVSGWVGRSEEENQDEFIMDTYGSLCYDEGHSNNIMSKWLPVGNWVSSWRAACTVLGWALQIRGIQEDCPASEIMEALTKVTCHPVSGTVLIKGGIFYVRYDRPGSFCDKPPWNTKLIVFLLMWRDGLYYSKMFLWKEREKLRSEFNPGW